MQGDRLCPVLVAGALAPYLLVASSGHQALRFLAPAFPAAAVLAALGVLSMPSVPVRRAVAGLLVARAAVASVLVVRLFFVDSRAQASRWLEAHTAPGETVDLIANNPGYAPPIPAGRALRIVPTLSREMAPADRFAEAAARLSVGGVAVAGPHRLLLRALPRASRAAPGADALLPGPARGPRRLRGGGALPPDRMAASRGGVRGPGDRDPAAASGTQVPMT